MTEIAKLLKECRAVFKWMEYEPWRNIYDEKCGEMVTKLDAALAAEEKRKPDAWMHKSTLDVIPAWCHHGDKEEWYTRPLYRSIAPPQVKSERSSVAEDVAPQPGQPADGAAQCPRQGG